jgi:hypothetical protein
MIFSNTTSRVFSLRRGVPKERLTQSTGNNTTKKVAKTHTTNRKERKVEGDPSISTYPTGPAKKRTNNAREPTQDVKPRSQSIHQ